MSIFEGIINLGMENLLNSFGDEFFYAYKETPSIFFKIKGIFEAKTVIIETSNDIPVESFKPTLSLKKSDFDLRPPKKGDLVIINSKTYEVTNTDDDGHSETRLVLMIKGEKSYA